jgi:16S rRNA (adenine1518-N6/adenine1519-N6)-dimethyltransferase
MVRDPQATKRLGQHFLGNRAAINKIVAALELKNGDTVIEIGPGEGALTLPLAQACSQMGCTLVAIEKDKALVKKLETRNERLEIIPGDALKILPILISHFSPLTSFKLAGNIPYYITGHLLRILADEKKKPRLAVLTIQAEVAKRITARPPKMNLLGAVTQFWAEPSIIQLLKATDFNPPPKVASAIIRLVARDLALPAGKEIEESEQYYRFVKILFKQPRKTIWNNLRSGFKNKEFDLTKLLERLSLPQNARPGALSLKVLIKLASSLKEAVL